MDLIDRQIVEFLQKDGSLSVSDLADRFGMTPPPCWRRVKALKESGVLSRQVWVADRAKLGLNLCIYATIELATHDLDATTAFRTRIEEIPEILECYILLGSVDVLLKIVVPDAGYYESFFYQTLSLLPGVRKVTSSVMLSEVKCTTAVPVNLTEQHV